RLSLTPFVPSIPKPRRISSPASPAKVCSSRSPTLSAIRIARFPAMHDRFRKKYRLPAATERLRRQIALEAARRILGSAGQRDDTASLEWLDRMSENDYY